MSDRSRGTLTSRFDHRLAIATIVLGLFALVVLRLGGFQPWIDVPIGDGVVAMPNGLASVDHPFHVSRAEILRREIGSGRLPQWITSHQGGYPVFFYPLGAAWITLVWWASAFGVFPIEWAHTMSVATIAVLPFAGFWLFARRDRLPWSVPVLALMIHLAVPGSWWHGGWTELVQWGLVTNVAGAAWLLLAAGFMTNLVAEKNRLWLVGAALAAAMAIVTNPRSLFGLAVLCLAVPLTQGAAMGWETLRSGLFRTIACGALAAALAAPVVLPLMLYQDQYEFLRFGTYVGLWEYLQSSVNAVWWPVACLALIGAVGCWLPFGGAGSRLTGMRTLSVIAIGYIAITLGSMGDQAFVSQLEATRLMPFQRLVIIALAASTVGWISQLVLGRGWQRSALAVDLIPLTLGLVILGWWLRPGGEPIPVPGPPDPPARGMFAVVHSAVPSQFGLKDAIHVADAQAAPGTAIAVIGSDLSWHQQLWAPRWSGRQFFYNDWLWYWTNQHPGTRGYVPQLGHFYPDPDRMLDREYLESHAIGAVVITGDTDQKAAGLPWLNPLTGNDTEPTYHVWLVADPVPVVSVDNRGLINLYNEGARWMGESPGDGTALVVQQSFPGWVAETNGQPQSISAQRSTFIAIGGLSKNENLVVAYIGTSIRWLGRVLSIVAFSVAGALVFLGVRERMTRSEGAMGSAPAEDLAS